MKKLNITKEAFEKSNYFKNKYGKLEYVSESGNLFKTDKGKVLMFKESETSQWIEVDIIWGSENDSLPDTVFVKTTTGKMPSRIELENELEETYEDQIIHIDTYPVSEIDSLCDCFKCIGDKLKPFDPSRITKKELQTNWESTKKFGKKFNESDESDVDVLEDDIYDVHAMAVYYQDVDEVEKMFRNIKRKISRMGLLSIDYVREELDDFHEVVIDYAKHHNFSKQTVSRAASSLVYCINHAKG